MGLVERAGGAGAAAGADRASAGSHGERASAARRARRPVLLVDAKGWDRDALAAALRAAGFRPMTLPGPERALAHLREVDEPCEAVLVPERVPGGAVALEQQLRALRAGLRVRVVGHAERPSDVAVSLAG